MNRVGIGLLVPALQTTQPGWIDSLESILGLLKSLKIRALRPAPPHNISKTLWDSRTYLSLRVRLPTAPYVGYSDLWWFLEKWKKGVHGNIGVQIDSKPLF